MSKKFEKKVLSDLKDLKKALEIDVVDVTVLKADTGIVTGGHPNPDKEEK